MNVVDRHFLFLGFLGLDLVTVSLDTRDLDSDLGLARVAWVTAVEFDVAVLTGKPDSDHRPGYADADAKGVSLVENDDLHADENPQTPLTTATSRARG